MHELVYGLVGIGIGLFGRYVIAFLVQKAKNDALKKDSEEVALLKERGKNLATKEDIEEITRLQEETKSVFQEKMELQKAELGRISKEFELYAAKKHEYYPELYKHIQLCYGKVSALRGLVQTRINSHDYNKNDIDKLMSDRGFTEAQKEVILSDWDADKNVAINHIDFILQRINYHEAQDSYREAHNFHLLHELYFSKKISSDARNLLDEIYKLWKRYNPNEDFHLETKNTEYISKFLIENESLINSINRKNEDLLNSLRGELKVEVNNNMNKDIE
ncbi:MULTISPECIES: hypothetical protein [Bacillus cereus group]|uniref:hypothetical protein n=1 Tax=Bacillus cereus group TaxID=86661 RepID=UPI001239618C|nr:hypothetical protein [Bacillus cereus]KAA6457024.1 hypothetical protein DX930_30180 [Bacillus cereus]KAB2418912.1 hypothetical protein F8169_00335 [Bacillus cereus]KAB2439253.1 hypothetical protein F8166_00325 [Bacillus cereus]KAB2470234.1 hypothetical protein F8164_03675 [Bacillus cereus]